MPTNVSLTPSSRNTRSILTRVRESIRSFWRGPISSKDPALARLFRDGPPASSGIYVDEASALRLAPVWAAVRLISSDLASLPLLLYKRHENGGRVRATDHRLYHLLHNEPNSEMTSMVFRETLQAHVLTWGNAYAEIERNVYGQPVALWPITPDRVQPFRAQGRDALGAQTWSPLRYRIDGTTEFDARDLLHIPGLGFDGVIGYGVVRMARESIGLGLAAEQFGGSFFGNGSWMGGVLSSTRDLDDEQCEAVAERITNKNRGADRAHQVIVLGADFKFERLGLPNQDSQWLEGRQFQVSDVARWFQVPPHRIGNLDKATFSNIEHQTIEYVTSTLRQWLVRWEQELTRKLLSASERRAMFIEHTVEGLLRGDSQARAEFYSKMFQIGAFSINEIRALENQNPIGPDGDKHYVPVNLAPVDQPPIQTPPANRMLETTPQLNIAILDPEQAAIERGLRVRKEEQEEKRRTAADARRLQKLERLKRELDGQERQLEAERAARVSAWIERRGNLARIKRRYPDLAEWLAQHGTDESIAAEAQIEDTFHRLERERNRVN